MPWSAEAGDGQAASALALDTLYPRPHELPESRDCVLTYLYPTPGIQEVPSV